MKGNKQGEGAPEQKQEEDSPKEWWMLSEEDIRTHQAAQAYHEECRRREAERHKKGKKGKKGSGGGGYWGI